MNNVQLVKMPVLGVLVLFIWIWVGIRILREVKRKHFADDTISLLREEEKESQLILESYVQQMFPMRIYLTTAWDTLLLLAGSGICFNAMFETRCSKYDLSWQLIQNL